MSASKAMWKPNGDADHCNQTGCPNIFGYWWRRHHCRACGEIFCSSCLRNRIMCSGYTTPELACDSCIVDAQSLGAAVPSHASSTQASVDPAVQTVQTAQTNQQLPATAPQGTSSVSFDVVAVQALCKAFKPQVMTAGYNVAFGAKSMLEEAALFLPDPFNAVCTVSAQVIGLAINSVVNSAESCRLANRVARVSYGILLLVGNPGGFNGASELADHLLAVFNDAIKLLQQFQHDTSKERTFVEIIQQKFMLYSTNTIDEFNSIHNRLTVAIQDRTFVASVAHEMDPSSAPAPTLDQIQQSLQREVAHVVEAVKQEGVLHHIESKLSNLLQTMSNISGSRSVDCVLDPHAVVIDKNNVLGKGASGTVYAGILYGTTEVAVKVMLGASSGDADVVKEMERTMRVAHRNVVKVYGLLTTCVEFEGHPAIVIERLGRSLAAMIAFNTNSKLLESAAMKLTNDMISGMASVHDCGFVHFDLKPSNIMLTQDGRTAKIVDFGIAHSKTTVAFARGDEKAFARGTVAYMAPEILLGAPLGPFCDVYSFGSVLYALWSGKLPWQGFVQDTIKACVMAGSMPKSKHDMISEGLPEPIVALVLACWDAPAKRPTFKSMQQIDNGMFWLSHTSHWPELLRAAFLGIVAPALQTPPAEPTPSRFFPSEATARLGNTPPGAPPIPFSCTSIIDFSSDELGSWLSSAPQRINKDVVDWLVTKKINGEMFVNDGASIVGGMRMNLMTMDQWYIDALERCFQNVRRSIDDENHERERLEAAREMARESIARVNEAKRQEEDRRAMETARASERHKCVELNLAVVSSFRDWWDTKNASIDEIVRCYSPNWSATDTICGKMITYQNVDDLTTRLLYSQGENWQLMPQTFHILEQTDVFVLFSFSHFEDEAAFTTTVRFDFDPPGQILRSTQTVNRMME
jgi:serine/threonine protein kinase